ncbi:MAG: gamma-glutamylcyclotransferase [Azospirillum brasilense]|uniref:glutathione-specific gamma-glutamylcyclotransferase n=1 Tax=Roseomonas gilardii TaxID=257708 RepID=A0A1L7AFP5_9PROT|nr:gamma-glutamylcyclotransferase [Roseomonas gilardii]APT57551.1 calcium transporter ChaC [Roseomonas gilardii]PZR17932.1 MAG: gamma-glutamylcyclotransferase [Azospirillum brasilense]
MSLTDPPSPSDPDEEISISGALTRDLLRSGKLDRMVSAAVPGLRLMSDAEREASLRQTLAARPGGADGAWVFAYGSLMWNPTIHHAERRVARVEGWHRSFCLSTPIGRGTPENPGLVLALDEGGHCDGVALRLDEPHLSDELSLLWRREMLTGAYRPVWVPLRDLRGQVFGHGIAFVIDPAGPQCVRLGEAETVRRLATARGQIGSSADYLFRTQEGLEALELSDPAIERLAGLVAGFGAAA